MGGWKDNVWRWGDLGLQGLVGEEPVLLAQIFSLRGRLENFEGWKVGMDYVVLMGNSDRTFSVASCYVLYERSRSFFGPPTKHADVFSLLWESSIPFKVKVFGWRLFLNRFPTKDLLAIRGMYFSVEDVKCKFFVNSVESRDHLFFCCRVVQNIWSAIAFWVGKGVSLEEGCLANFMD